MGGQGDTVLPIIQLLLEVPGARNEFLPVRNERI